MNTTAARQAELAEYRRIDNECARLWSLFHETDGKMRVIVKYIEDKVKYANKSYNQNERYQAEAAKQIAAYEAQLAELRPVREERRDAAVKYNEDNYTGWPRFFHVVHLHSNMHCSSFRPTTRIGWLPDVSGLTEAEAVAIHGEALCTICFPSAPTALTQKQVDPAYCTGTSYDRTKPHELRRMSKWGTCTECGTVQTVTSTGKVRKHKKPTN